MRKTASREPLFSLDPVDPQNLEKTPQKKAKSRREPRLPFLSRKLLSFAFFGGSRGSEFKSDCQQRTRERERDQRVPWRTAFVQRLDSFAYPSKCEVASSFSGLLEGSGEREACGICQGLAGLVDLFSWDSFCWRMLACIRPLVDATRCLDGVWGSRITSATPKACCTGMSGFCTPRFRALRVCG